MVQEEFQASKGDQHFQRIPWVIAIVFILLLSACFIANCLVTRNFFLRCERSMGVFKFPEHHTYLRCIEESVLKGTGATRNCCPIGWIAFKSNCYFPFNDNKTWVESERSCLDLGAEVAIMNTEDELNFIIQYLDKKFSYFLGPSHENPEVQKQRADKTPLNPHHSMSWLKGRPNNQQNENCAVLVNDQDKWTLDDISCNFEASRICKKPGRLVS